MHVRSNCKNLSTTISLDETVMLKIEDYRFGKRKQNRSEAIADLVMKGLKYEALLEKKRERMSC